ncbi:hypothetical protein C3F42_13425 [Pseudomonas sp. PONIH3]|nr:hypothetical protein C3F42_13425 [Pseudomonas sp. PONIH3]
MAAWFLALALNVMLWGQEVVLAQAPGVICLVQLMLLVPILWLASTALYRHGQSALYRGLLSAAAAGTLASSICWCICSRTLAQQRVTSAGFDMPAKP